jgi:hypothetical protein
LEKTCNDKRNRMKIFNIFFCAILHSKIVTLLFIHFVLNVFKIKNES